MRCGACKQIFNGVENLLGPEVTPASRPATSLPKPPNPAPLPPKPANPPGNVLPSAAETTSTSYFNAGMPASAGTATPSSLNLSPPTAFPAPTVPRGLDQPEAAQNETDVDPLTRMTLMDFTAYEEAGAAVARHEEQLRGARRASDTDTPDEIERALDDLQKRPWRGQARTKNSDHESLSYEESEEPDFVRHARRRQQVGHKLKWVYGTLSFLLAVTLAAQLIYAFRDQLAQRVPQAAPWLQQACFYLGCALSYPTPIDSLAIESSELEALPGQAGSFQLRVLLRNRYDTTAAWPYLELSLIDAQENPVARRSFAPSDYLGSAEQFDAGFAAQSEQAVRLQFVLQGQQASGFRVYLFYP